MLDFKELKDWFDNDFIKRNGGFVPKDFTKWYDTVEKSHEKTREFFGAKLVEHKFEIPGGQKPIDLDTNKDLINEILNIVPGFLDNFGLTREIFLFPNIDNGNHNSERVGKKIIQFAKDYNGPYFIIKPLEKLISTLGEIWARNRTSKEEVSVTLSTTQLGFILLGHYGPDDDSCFRQGSDKTRHKYALAQSLDTFVLSIDGFSNKFNKKINRARCCGFFNPTYDCMNLMNYYYCPGFSEANGLQSIEIMAEHILKKPVKFVEGNIVCKGGIFHNPYGNWSFTSLTRKADLPTQILVSNFADIYEDRCEVCESILGVPADIYTVDDNSVCYRCVEKAFRCQITNVITFKRLLVCIDEHGSFIQALPEVVREFAACDKCGNKAKSTRDIGGEEYCERCIGDFCTTCDGCEELFEKNELEESESGRYCSDCVVNPQDCEPIF